MYLLLYYLNILDLSKSFPLRRGVPALPTPLNFSNCLNTYLSLDRVSQHRVIIIKSLCTFYVNYPGDAEIQQKSGVLLDGSDTNTLSTTRRSGGKLEEWISKIRSSICTTIAEETLELPIGSIKFKARPMHPHTQHLYRFCEI